MEWYNDGAFPECHLWGEKFNPNILNNIPQIIITNSIATGEIGKRGKYKNHPTPYGACQIIVPREIKQGEKIIWLADFIIKHKSDFEKAGATKNVFWIYWFGGQGNMELSEEEIEKIYKTKLPLAMDYIFNEE
ncbi:hypothetical protein DET65_3867 [Sunxiuqinia elliptica]|uniref:Uncharacterized protein n=2 Tax=Sunxiuqinia elliptica TaxID=655355 RepID=A0A4R6GU42_9BACT|nr:hypothetical protein DET52_1073 [Sunxiuqinia elliptica]TDO56317.1 hypothetical protein DET65_3867 [Sunxiuqinia elliptica]